MRFDEDESNFALGSQVVAHEASAFERRLPPPALS
jgi:hypothetical protein